MRTAALVALLAAALFGAEAVAELLHDDAGIHPLGSFD